MIQPGASGKEPTYQCREDPLEEGMASHSSILAWRIPLTEEPGGLQSMGLQKSQAQLSDKKKKNKKEQKNHKS